MVRICKPMSHFKWCHCLYSLACHHSDFFITMYGYVSVGQCFSSMCQKDPEVTFTKYWIIKMKYLPPPLFINAFVWIKSISLFTYLKIKKCKCLRSNLEKFPIVRISQLLKNEFVKLKSLCIKINYSFTKREFCCS